MQGYCGFLSVYVCTISLLYSFRSICCFLSWYVCKIFLQKLSMYTDRNMIGLVYRRMLNVCAFSDKSICRMFLVLGSYNIPCHSYKTSIDAAWLFLGHRIFVTFSLTKLSTDTHLSLFKWIYIFYKTISRNTNVYYNLFKIFLQKL